MNDGDVLRLLATLGMDDLSFRVLPVLPLIQVAWADGEVAEAEAVSVRAFAQGYAPGREGQLLIDDWLRHRPTDAYFRRGTAALCVLAGRENSPLTLSRRALDEVRRATREVARVHGGFLGFGAVSRAEADALDAVREALEARVPPPSSALSSRRRVTIACDTETFDPTARDAVLVPDLAPDRRCPIEDDGTVVGAELGCAVRVEHDESVAPRHLRIYRDSRRFYVEDLDSPAGTFVDGERVGRRRLLGGERVEAGRAGFTFRLLRRIPLQMIS